MTDCFWLEFDPDKLAILKQEAYELDLSLEEYLSEMLEDMVSFNREKTEDEANMDKYKTIKWKLKEPNKKSYDLNKFSGIKKYVNDCIKYKAAAEYGITKIIYDDTTHGTVMVGIFLLNTFQTLNIIRSIQILFFRQVLELQLMN